MTRTFLKGLALAALVGVSALILPATAEAGRGLPDDWSLIALDLRGRGGRHINEGWAAGPSSYLGLSTHGFPNLFMILGPNGPFTNLPPSIESQVDWISETIGHAERSGVATVEPSREAEDG